MKRLVCVECGAEYAGHAEYCNVCGATRFERIEGPAPEAPALRKDGSILWAQGVIWLIALVYLIGERAARRPTELFLAWLLAASLGLALGLATRHLRAAAVFAAAGAAFMGIAGLIG